MSGVLWTDKQIDALRLLWAQGKTYQEIGIELGDVTANSIRNKARRLELPRRGKPKKIWTAQKVETLKELWAEGISASLIAKALGDLTRNAVIGKVYRLKLSRREVTKRLPHYQVNPPKHRPVLKPKPVPLPPPVEPTGAGVRIVDLPSNGCKFAVSHDHVLTHLFCGRPRQDGSSYCAWHHRICWQAPRTRSVPTFKKWSVFA